MAEFDPEAYDKMVNTPSSPTPFNPDAYDAAVNGSGPVPASIPVVRQQQPDGPSPDGTGYFVDGKFFKKKFGVLGGEVDPRGFWAQAFDPTGVDNPAIPKERRPKEDPSVLQNMAYPGGIARTAYIDLMRRIAGTEKQTTQDDYRQAFSGNAKSSREMMRENKINPVASAVGGLVTDTVTDPYAALYRGFKVGEAAMPSFAEGAKAALQNVDQFGIGQATLNGLKKVAGWTKNALVQPTEDSVGPVSKALQGVGNSAFNNNKMVRNSERALTKFGNSAEIPEGTAADELTNLGLGGSNKDISDRIAAGKDEVGAKIGKVLEQAGSDGKTFDIAPDLEKHAFLGKLEDQGMSVDDLNAKIHQVGMPDEAAVNHKSASEWVTSELSQSKKDLTEAKRAQAAAKKWGLPDVDAQMEANVAAKQSHHDNLAELGQVFDADPTKYLKSLLASEDPADRAKGIATLKAAMPDFASGLDKAERYMMNAGTNAPALHFLNGLIRDAKQGPRNLQGIGSWKTSLQDLADGSLPMETNAYANYVRSNSEKQIAMDIAGDVGDQMEKTIAAQLDSKPELAAYPELKRQYMILSRIAKPASSAAQQAMSRSTFSKLDWAGGASVLSLLAAGDVKAALIAAGIGIPAKLGQETYQNPAFAIQARKTLQNAAQFGLPDSMIRKAAINGAAPRNEGGPDTSLLKKYLNQLKGE